MSVETSICVVWFGAIFAAGCASAAPEPSGGSRDRVVAEPRGSAVSELGRGFYHAFERSRFVVGGGAQELADLGLLKVVGSDGAFARNPANGSIRAILNGDSLLLLNFKALTDDADEHNAETLAYFRAAGLPSLQVGSLEALPSMSGGSDGSGKGSPDRFVDYASVIHRVVAGYKIPDSYAWAIFDSNRNVVQEAVHWPSVPDVVIDAARDLSVAVATQDKLDVFRRSLPAEVAGLPGEVVIRHGSTGEPDPAPFACYEVYFASRGGRGRTRDFTLGGAEVEHPSFRAKGARRRTR